MVGSSDIFTTMINSMVTSYLQTLPYIAHCMHAIFCTPYECMHERHWYRITWWCIYKWRIIIFTHLLMFTKVGWFSINFMISAYIWILYSSRSLSSFSIISACMHSARQFQCHYDSIWHVWLTWNQEESKTTIALSENRGMNVVIRNYVLHIMTIRPRKVHC